MKKDLYIGIDIGGTKIAIGLVTSTGKIINRFKMPTPPRANGRNILQIISVVLSEIFPENTSYKKRLAGIGIGIPGIVDIDQTKILVTPNIDMARFPLGSKLKKKYGVKVVLGNDVNLGLLGEQWLGAAKGARNVIGIFPGTGIGGAVILKDNLVLGSNGAAAEFGHMIMQVDGPLCSCGNHGCLEAMASRWAIQRDIRAAIKKGKKSIVTKLTKGKLSIIKSKILKEALKRRDPVVISIFKQVGKILGKACISLNHCFNPEMIVLGGGVIKACGFFLLPVIKKSVDKDPFFKKFDKCKVVSSQLGDDAVILGAVALAKNKTLT